MCDYEKLGVLARSDAPPPGVQTVVGSILDPAKGNILSWRFGHEILSTVILSLPLTQVGQLSVIGERMCTKYWLTA